MADEIKILLTLLVGLGGSWMGVRLKMPAGALIGAIFSVGAFQLATGLALFPPEWKVIISIVTGACLGAKVTREDIRSMGRIPFAALTMMIGMFGYNFFCCFILNRFAGLDPMSGMLATAPGGLAEMCLAAVDVGANTAMVSSIQIMRLSMVAATTPMVLKFVLKHWTHGETPRPAPEVEVQTEDAPRAGRSMIRTLIVALIFGLVGEALNIPAGALCLSMVGCVLYNLWTHRAYMPVSVRQGAQCCNGAIIGARLLMEDLVVIRSILPLVLVLTLGWSVLNILLGWILHRYGKLSPETALFATAPGGMSDMGLIAAELGGNAAQVSVLQLCRVVCVIALSPAIAILFD